MTRIYTTDAVRRTCDAGVTKKVKIASFAGEHFVAERDGGELHVYMITDGDDVPGVSVPTNDGGGIRTVADLARHARRVYGGC